MDIHNLFHHFFNLPDREFVKQQGLFEDLGEGVAELAVFLAKNSRSSKK